ncbi:hypothetical protein ACFC0A_13380, partial [Kitasatospora purpeofusca]
GPGPRRGPGVYPGAGPPGGPAAAPARPSDGLVNLLKPGVPPTPPLPPHPVDLRKAGAWQPAVEPEPEVVPEPEAEVVPEPVAEVVPEAVPEAEVASESVAEVVPEPEPVEESEPTDAAPADAPPGDAEPEDAPADAPEEPEAEAEPEPEPEPEAAEPAPSDATPAPDHTQPRADYREVIGRIVRSADAGDHAAATDLAFALELEAIAEHGPVSATVLQVRQVRAHVSRLAGRTAEAAGIYREVALTLLRSEGPEHPETQHAATNAEACWRAIPDREEALRIAPEIIELRAYLPGPDGRKLRAAERHLAALAATGADPA